LAVTEILVKNRSNAFSVDLEDVHVVGHPSQGIIFVKLS
jgi:hypothetical protein